MTLNEKFRDLDSMNWRNDENEKIADEFAIGFLEWVDKNGLEVLWNRGTKQPKQLLEIYKKEKGL